MAYERSQASVQQPLSRLDPARVHEMRECFQVLDRDNDGHITREDVQDAFAQIGQDASSANMAAFFPQGLQSMALSSYLNGITAPLSQFSSPQELLAAFAAFDPDDSGQIDIHTLRTAMLNASTGLPGPAMNARDVERVLEGFSGKRAFAKGMGADAGRRGEVFRYTEFVQSLTGGPKSSNQSQI